MDKREFLNPANLAILDEAERNCANPDSSPLPEDGFQPNPTPPRPTGDPPTIDRAQGWDWTPLWKWLRLSLAGIVIIIAAVWVFNSVIQTRGDEPGDQAPPFITRTSGVILSDNFAVDNGLNSSLWSSNTEFLRTLARRFVSDIPSAWVNPRIRFSPAGMSVSGVSGTYQFTGVQSNQPFRPPFEVQATVKGTTANGNPFDFYLVSKDFREAVRLAGNINKRNSGYYGMMLTVGSLGTQSSSHTNIYETPDVNLWYTITVAVDASGNGKVALKDSKGATLGSQDNLRVGRGPFFLVLGQMEGAPYTVGPNVAIWRSAQVFGDSIQVSNQSKRTSGTNSSSDNLPSTQLTGEIVSYANFSEPRITSRDMDITPSKDGFAYNDAFAGRFGGTWRITKWWGGFTGTFDVPADGKYYLVVKHGSSYDEVRHQDGYSPVTIKVNSQIVVQNFSPARPDPGPMPTDRWPILVQAGRNTLEWKLEASATTHYWIQEIEIMKLSGAVQEQSVAAK